MTTTATHGQAVEAPLAHNEPEAALATAGPLSRLLAPVRPHLIGCAALSAASAAAGIVPYMAVAEMARALLAEPAGSAARVWEWVGIGAAGAALWLLLLVQSSRLGHYADAAILHALRVRIVQHLGTLPLGWFRVSGSGRVKRAMTGDLEEMHEVIAHALGQLTGAVTVTVVATTYLLIVDVPLALVAIGVVAVMAACYRISMRSMTIHMNRLIAAEAAISAASIEYADGIQVVKTFGTGRRVLHRFDDAATEYANAFADWVAEVRLSSAATRVFGSEISVLAAVTGAGLFSVANGTLDVADLVPFLVVAVGLPTSILPAVSAAQGVRKGRMGAANIERLLTRPPLPEPLRPQYPREFGVQFDNVSFSYDGRMRVIDGVSAMCPPGQVTAIVGPSGAGKTTMAALLPRFYDVTDGSVRIGGVDVRSIPSTELLGAMSLVFQDIVLLRDSVAENIRIGRPHASDAEVRRAAVAAQIDGVIERLPCGYDTLLDAGGGALSGGERQRLTIARAILSEAPIVVLDEATASLDPDNEAAVQDALAALAAGKTVIVIAHRLNTIAGAQQILVLDRGRIVERGTHDQLLARGGLYARMWVAQEGVSP